MNRVVCQVIAACLVLAGCQTPSLFSSKKPTTNRPADDNRIDKGTSPWLDRNSIADRRGNSTADPRETGRGADRGRTDSDLNKAHDALSRGRIREAKSLYERVLADDPENASAHHRLGTIADRERDFRAASRHYAAALKQRRNDAALLSDVGWSSFLQKRYTESEHYLKRAVEIDRTNSKALYNLGWLYGVRQQPELAYQMFLRAGPPEKARRLMAQLKEANETRGSEMLAGGSRGGGRTGGLRAPDPNGSRNSENDGDGGASRRDINYTLRRKMDLARERDLARRHGDPGRYGDESIRIQPQPGPSPERHSGTRTMPGDFRPGGDDHRFEPDRRMPSSRDPRYANRRPSASGLNDEMRRIDSQSDPRRPVGRADVGNNAGIRQTDYADPRPGDTHRRDADRVRPGDPRRPRSSDPSSAWPAEDDLTRDNRGRRLDSPRGTVRYADSRRELPNGIDRRPPSRPVDPLHREALRLGHNTGAGGVPFPIVENGSRSDRTLPSPDRGRPRADDRRPVAPTPWRGGDRDERTDRGYEPNANAVRGAGPAAGRDGMSRDFDNDGPAILPRSKGSIARD